MTSALFSTPATPSRFHAYDSTYAHLPAMSSPLASSEAGGSSPPHSPSVYASQRRRAQYKSRGEPTTPTHDRRRTSRRVSQGSIPFALTRQEQPVPAEEPPRKVILREQFKARCIERANKDRERRIKGKRRAIELSSDGVDEFMDCEDDEDDEAVMDDPFFQRVMSNFRHKEKHSYRLSYAQEVGSSFDPDMEDVGEWEGAQQEEEEPPSLPVDYDELDEEELAQLAEERELLDGLNVDEIFSLSDLEDDYNASAVDEDVEMS